MSQNNLKVQIKDLQQQFDSLKKKFDQKSIKAALFESVSFLTSKNFSLERFLDLIIDQVLHLTKSLSAAIFLLDETKETLEFAVVKGPGSEKLLGMTLSVKEGIAGQVVTSGNPYVSQDVQKDPFWSSKAAEIADYHTTNLVAVPLKIKGSVKGVLEVINKQNDQPFTDDDVSLLKTLAPELMLAIENARLLDEARRRAQEFKTLARLSNILNSVLDQKTIRQKTMESVVELLKFETGSLYLIDEEKNELYFEVALGENNIGLKKQRLKMGEGVAGWVAEKGKSLLLTDTSKDSRWARHIAELSNLKTLNMITVPVKAKNKTIGVLQAINKLEGKKPTGNDLHLLENLSDQVAIALENTRLYEEQKAMFKETAEAIVTAIEKRDPYTGGHTKRVRDYCLALAKRLDSPEIDMEWLELAAILHDTGKIGVDDQVLRKPGLLSDEEFEKMKQHPTYGNDILQHIKQLKRAIPGMKRHHERIDGKGYPEGLTKSDIPLSARIISVADTWDAMTSDRPYRKAMSDQAAIKELKKFSGIQFDKKVVVAFLKAHEHGEIVSISSLNETEKEKPFEVNNNIDYKPKGYKE